VDYPLCSPSRTRNIQSTLRPNCEFWSQTVWPTAQKLFLSFFCFLSSGWTFWTLFAWRF
jgi:hypothetical protein